MIAISKVLKASVANAELAAGKASQASRIRRHLASKVWVSFSF
jgi:hypothetical protein